LSKKTFLTRKKLTKKNIDEAITEEKKEEISPKKNTHDEIREVELNKSRPEGQTGIPIEENLLKPGNDNSEEVAKLEMDI